LGDVWADAKAMAKLQHRRGRGDEGMRGVGISATPFADVIVHCAPRRRELILLPGADHQVLRMRDRFLSSKPPSKARGATLVAIM
jgi:hypothetical protein